MGEGVSNVGLMTLLILSQVPGCGGEVDAPESVTNTVSALSHHGSPGGGPLEVACETLAGELSLPNTEFTSSSTVAAGVLTLAGQSIGAHCLLTGKMFERTSPVDGQTYAIGFQMRLPVNWNGRFYYQANGGTDGSVVPATGDTSGGGPLTSALLQGFAVISSDAGHDEAQNPFFGIDPQARLDFGYQAVGKLTPMAKDVIREAYGKGPAYSYIGGCSNGGRHAMVAAARIPDQYDGYLVGSPGFELPKAAVASIYGAQQYAPLAVPGATIPIGPFAGLPDLSGAFTPQERQLLSDGVLNRCDALDGVTDGMVNDVLGCQRRFDLDRDVPTCSGDRDGSCLSAAQKQAIGNIFAGPRDAAGDPIYSNFFFDSGHASAGTQFWEYVSPLILDSGGVGFIFKTPPADPASFVPPLFALTADVDLLAQQIFATNATYTQSGMEFMTPPDPTHPSGVRRRHGRMIVYHGVSDPIFSAADTVRWFEELHGRRSFARLFLVPGMDHCAGGPAADQFDLLTPLVRWVEGGPPPNRVVASVRGPDNVGGFNPEVPATWSPTRTRPLCPYPRIAVYHHGDVERAESFVCKLKRP